MKLFLGLIDRIFSVIGALGLSQVPLFMQQYKHQLAGHISELQLQIHQMTGIAGQSGKTLMQLIQKFRESPDSDFARQGDLMHRMVMRLQSLSEGFLALDTASAFKKPFVFLYHLNGSIAKATLHSFDPGLSFSLEGILYALCGIVLGFLVFKNLVLLGRGIVYLFTPKNHQKVNQGKAAG